MNTTRAVSLLLRLGVSLALLYPAFNAYLDPYHWLSFMPPPLFDIVPDMLLIHGFGVVEIVLGLWILSGRNVFIPALGATLVFVLVVVSNVQEFQTLFTTLSMAGMALALALIHRPHLVKQVEERGAILDV